MARRNDLCTGVPPDGHTLFSNAWAMLQQTDGNGYAQIGYERHTPGAVLEFFAAFKKYTGASQVLNHFTDQGPNLGTAYRFKVTWKDGANEDNQIHLILCDAGGGNCRDHTPAALGWNPSSAGWGGSAAAWAGEVNDHTSDIPGLDTKPATFNAIQIRNHSGGWYVPSSIDECRQEGGSGCSDSYYAYHWQSTSSSTFEIWTKPIAR
ncbi:MAG: hypothetical protein ACE14W_04450 [Candidatus Velamenicoccus archaeovorus]